MRGSDPDAAFVLSGENDLCRGRPEIYCAASCHLCIGGCGQCDPHALQVAVSAMQAVNFIGMPEGRIPLAQAVTYVACAPKSNASYLGIDKALSDVRNIRIVPFRRT